MAVINYCSQSICYCTIIAILVDLLVELFEKLLNCSQRLFIFFISHAKLDTCLFVQFLVVLSAKIFFLASLELIFFQQNHILLVISCAFLMEKGNSSLCHQIYTPSFTHQDLPVLKI